MGAFSFIPYPDVPIAPGVPNVLRPLNGVIADNPALAIAIGGLSNILSAAIDTKIRWGLFDSTGALVGMPPTSGSNKAEQIALSLITNGAATLSVLDTGFVAEATAATYQVEGGVLVAYNKVNRPDMTNVRLVFTGNDSDRAYFVAELRAAKASTNLYSFVSPEMTLINQTVLDVRIQRRAEQGLDMIIADIDLQEIRAVSAQYTVAATPINTPANASATPTTNTGSVQTTTPDVSTLKSLMNKAAKSFGLGGS